MSDSLPDSEFKQLDIIRKIWRDIKKDKTTSSLAAVNFAHYKIHDGRSYIATYTTELGDGEVLEIRFATQDTTRWAHMVLSTRGALAATVELFEDTDYLHDAASDLTAHNRNRNSGRTSTLELCTSPSSSGQGDELFQTGWGAAGQGNFPGSGGGGREVNEWMLQQNSAYLLRITSGAAANRVAVELDWYEHTDVRSDAY